jgi:chromosome segregation protein
LELVGFKSFADKTRFEFPPGITVVVGPNGSGKSNVVDGIKWVLGEQSAKSLRGKDMADVIFKGTQGPNGRKPAGSASATIILENADRRLPLDTDEVHITRRVYRSGEGEYLINGETCRLKDIRNLIRGTGIGTDAYSLIEQGKVERLLQASKHDRRAIFEEAAGISRFNAKKIETQRRLARVDQNLIRLHDIVDEVGSRYRSIKSQASKAARYREYTQRLQELRTHVGLHDWREFSRQAAEGSEQLSTRQAAARKVEAEIVEADAEVQACEAEWENLSDQHTALQNRLASIREAVAGAESRLSLNQIRAEELGRRDTSLRELIDKSEAQAVELRGRQTASELELETAAREAETTQAQLHDLEAARRAQAAEAAEARNRLEQLRRQQSQLAGEVHELGKQISGLTSQASLGNEQRRQLDGEAEKLQALLTSLESQHAQCREEQRRLQANAEAIDSNLAAARRDVDATQATLELRLAEIGRLTSEHSGTTQRAEVLHEVEQRFEGINQGAQYILAQTAAASDEIWSSAIGLVADLVQVNVEHANIIDIALGEYAQYIVLRGGDLVRAIADGQVRVPGRAGLLLMDADYPPAAGSKISLTGLAGVISRADQLVQAKPEHEPLLRRVLGTTWIVKRLADALHLHAKYAPQLRFVTLDGEVVDFDGSVVLGARQAAMGIVSRRSELRALRREIHRLDEAMRSANESVTQLRSDLAGQQARLQELLSEHTETAKLLSRQQHLAEVAQQQIAQQQANSEDVASRLASVRSQLQRIEAQLATDQETLGSREAEAVRNEADAAATQTHFEQLEALLAESAQQATVWKVQLAKVEQRVHSLRGECDSQRRQSNETQAAVRDQRHELATCLWARRAALRESKSAHAEVSANLAAKSEVGRQLEQSSQAREALEQRRRTVRARSQQLRDAERSAQEELHQSALRLEKIQLEREQLAQRLREDYGIDLEALSGKGETESEQRVRSEVDAEIAELRQKLGNIGSVNMDALAELESLEQRYQTLDAQYRDLVHSKETLERIIQRINNESRRLFLETLDAIRANFQQLFRQTFGGGRADIVIEEGVDVLEAGVDIVATPPGKPEFSNTLLSGGEKALAAVSLLMAIFKFRPSPFCVLDEVDAPFDEANIGRFIEVLRSFLGWTKFVIVTHSKKTMTAATTLYGVTMQESGISKRVSVRFEEVGEEGQIAESALDRGDAPDADSQRGVA